MKYYVDVLTLLLFNECTVLIVCNWSVRTLRNTVILENYFSSLADNDKTQKFKVNVVEL